MSKNVDGREGRALSRRDNTEPEKVEIERELASEVCPGLSYSGKILTLNPGPPALTQPTVSPRVELLARGEQKAPVTNTAAQPSSNQS